MQVFGKTDIQKGKKETTLFADAVYKTDLSNIEQLPASKLSLLYSSIIHVNRSMYIIVNVLFYRFPHTLFYHFTSVPHHPCDRFDMRHCEHFLEGSYALFSPGIDEPLSVKGVSKRPFHSDKTA